MQNMAARCVLAGLFSLASCHEKAGTARFLRPIQPSGNAEVDEQDAAAIKRLEVLATLEKADGTAVATVAAIEERHMSAEAARASAMQEDGQALKKAAMLEYTRRIKDAKRELKASPEDEKAAEAAAGAQEATELLDAHSLQAAAARMKNDSVALRAEAGEETGDAKAVAAAAKSSLAVEAADVEVLEAAAKRERRPAKKIAAVKVASTISAEDAKADLADANSLRFVSLQEKAKAQEEWSKADEESRDADALKRAAMLGYFGRVKQAAKDLRGDSSDMHAARAAAEEQERRELTDSQALRQASAALRHGAEADSGEAEDTSSDATAIETAVRISQMPHF